MKTALQYRGGDTYADADIGRACTAVSKALDEATRGIGSHFYQAAETRYYTPDEQNCRGLPYGNGYQWALDIDDITSAATVAIDTAGDGSYSTIWTQGTDFYLDPANAALDGRPYEQLVIRTRGGRQFPNVQRAVKITGTFGWPSVPLQVSQYALFFVAQTVMRTRQAPFGILMQGMEVGATARIMRMDPDFDRFLGSLSRRRLLL